MSALAPIINGKCLNSKKGSGLLNCKCVRSEKFPRLIYFEDPLIPGHYLVCTCAIDDHAV